MTSIRETLRGWIFHDAWLKAVSLALAVVLFVVVRGDRDAATGAFLKVVYVLPRDRVLVSDPVAELRITVRGPWTRVSRFDERELEPLRVDLSAAVAGDYRFGEEAIKLPAGLRLGSITPPSVRLAFEPKIERAVPVQPILEGDPAPGYRVVRSVARPREIKLSGARSAVESTQRVATRPLRIAEARGPVHGTVRLEAPPSHAAWTSIDEVELDVEIVPALAERTLKAVPVRATGLARLDGKLEPESADVVLRGPAEALAEVPTGAPSLLIDAVSEDGRPPGAYRKRISVSSLPPGVAAEVRPEAVTLVTRRRRD